MMGILSFMFSEADVFKTYSENKEILSKNLLKKNQFMRIFFCKFSDNDGKIRESEDTKEEFLRKTLFKTPYY